MPSVRAETTPARSQRTESLGGMASPLLAACAPSGAALPLPSSTTSPVLSKPTFALQRASPSIIQWLSPTHGSPPHQELNLCSLSPPSSASAAEQQAKRRLGADDGSPAGREDTEQCDCDTKLSPAAKRSRDVSDVLCPFQERPDSDTDGSSQAASRQTGRENCSPTNWLSEMSQKMKSSQESFSIFRSPSSIKKQDGRTHASPVSTEHPRFRNKFTF